MRAEATELPPPAEAAMSTSKVLGDDNLLGEILLRLDSPTTLVRAALVSKRWLRGASGPAFLRCFRAFHPPRLLGFYVSGDCMPRPEFVPMPAPLPPEFAAAVRRASFRFAAFAEFWSTLWDCRNGRVLVDLAESYGVPQSLTVRAPLRYPGRDTAVLPPLPSCPTTWSGRPQAMLLPEDDGGGGGDGGASTICYRVHVDHMGRRVSAEVSVLRSGVWSLLVSSWAMLPRTPLVIPMITLLAGGKVYMLALAGFVIVLDLAAASLYAVELPDGVAYDYYGNLVPSRGDDGALYLFHVKGDRLSVWLRRTDHHGGAGEWVLTDTISLRETCGHLVEQGMSVSVVGVGDNAKFVFLEFDEIGAVVYVDVGSRRAEKVYQRDQDNGEIIQVHPFMMVWPPVFPTLDADEGEAGH